MLDGRSAAGAHGSGFVTEALLLTDGVMEFVKISDEKFGNRRDKTQAMLSGIDAGNFPTDINASPVRAAHFFVWRRPKKELRRPFRVPPAFSDRVMKGRRMANGPYS